MLLLKTFTGLLAQQHDCNNVSEPSFFNVEMKEQGTFREMQYTQT